MNQQSKLDLIAACALSIMLLGIVILMFNPLGYALIAGSVIVILFLFWKTSRTGE